MEKKDLFARIERLVEDIGDMYAEISALKEEMKQLLEENQRLGIENYQLRRLLRQEGQSLPDEPEISQHPPVVGEGYDNLARLYHEGFHICNIYYGHLRTEGDCLFCLSFLNK